MSSRRRTAAVLSAVLIAGLCFAPVFGLTSLLLPVGAVCAAGYGVTELSRMRPGLAPWRPALIILAGLLAVTETVLRATTWSGLPTAASLRALGAGLTSWQATLESTWPARPDPELVVFVPLLVLVACLLAVELLDRMPPLVALLPALAVAGISQLYIALTGVDAVLVALAFGATAAALFVPDRSPRGERGRAGSVAPLAAAVALVVIAVAGGVLAGAAGLLGRTPYSLQQTQSAVASSTRLASPLNELAGRLDQRNPDKVVFRYQSSVPVSRWRQVALDDFDGVNWSTDHPFLRLGSELGPGPEVTVPVSRQRATVKLTGLAGPWLPGQLLPSAVGGAVEPQVEPVGGTLLAMDAPGQYEITWNRPEVGATYLRRAGVNSDAPGGLGDLGAIPNEVTEVAQRALADRRATFATALALEAFMSKEYQLADKAPLPTGHSWPQLTRFLLDRQPGTSEQFAAGYVALARANGIPARLVVGFRAPTKPDADGWYTVTNRDALAWPEVAVDGVGWWPLDPAGQAAAGQGVVPGTDTEITNQARSAIPPIDEMEDPEVPPPPPAEDAGPGWGRIGVPVVWVFALSAALLMLWVGGVPLVKALRAGHRRRRPGSAAVVGAWAEVRDRLRAHGISVTSGMTVRDLVAASGEIADERAKAGLGVVARSVDQALWSGSPAGSDVARQAWDGVREVRRGLRTRPWTDRLYAALELRTLF